MIPILISFTIGVAAGYLIGWRSRGTEVAFVRGERDAAKAVLGGTLEAVRRMEAKLEAVQVRIGENHD